MIDTEYEILLKELLPLIQKQFEQISEIKRLTQELVEALDRNDQTTVKLLLKMRGDAMAETDKLVQLQNRLLHAYKKQSPTLTLILSGDPIPGQTELNEMEKRIHTLNRARKDALKKTVETDKIVNKRLTGSKSFYLK